MRRTRSDVDPYYNTFGEGIVLENISCWLHDQCRELPYSYKCGSQVMKKEVDSAACVVRPPGKICHRVVDCISWAAAAGEKDTIMIFGIATSVADAALFYEEIQICSRSSEN